MYKYLVTKKIYVDHDVYLVYQDMLNVDSSVRIGPGDLFWSGKMSSDIPYSKTDDILITYID